MSARDRFVAALRSRGMLRPGEEWVIDTNLDAFAHELAEQQREFVRRQASNPFHYGSAQWAVVGVDEAADLIDPHASSVRPDEEPTARVTLDNSAATFTPTEPLRPHYPDEEPTP